MAIQFKIEAVTSAPVLIAGTLSILITPWSLVYDLLHDRVAECCKKLRNVGFTPITLSNRCVAGVNSDCKLRCVQYSNGVHNCANITYQQLAWIATHRRFVFKCELL